MKEKIRNFIIFAAVILVAFLLQNAFSLALPQEVSTPNLFLIVVCFFGLMCGSNKGIAIGFACGLLVDVFYGDVIGFNALIYMYCGLFSGIFRRWFYSEIIIMPLLLVFINDFMFNTVYYGFRLLLRNKLDYPYYFEKIILPEMIITTFCALIVYKLFYLLNEKVISKEQRSALSFDK